MGIEGRSVGAVGERCAGCEANRLAAQVAYRGAIGNQNGVAGTSIESIQGCGVAAVHLIGTGGTTCTTHHVGLPRGWVYCHGVGSIDLRCIEFHVGFANHWQASECQEVALGLGHSIFGIACERLGAVADVSRGLGVEEVVVRHGGTHGQLTANPYLSPAADSRAAG